MKRVFGKLENEMYLRGNALLANIAMVFLAIAAHSGVAVAQPETFQKTKDATVSPEQLSASFAKVANRVEASVVNIDTKGKVPDIKLREKKSDGDDDILDYFRRNLPRRPSYAVGSGFIVDRTGYIMTNYHVVEDSARIAVRLKNGEEYIAKIVGADELTDLAVLKIEAKQDLPFLQFGDSEGINIGDWVLAIGSPFGLEQSVTAGIISQVNRETPSGSAFQKFIQTDAAINRGNSGGPLVNMQGEVIGVNSQIATSTGDYNGIGFALPANEASFVYRQILRHGKVRRGFLGVFLDSVKKEFAEVYNMPKPIGAIITQIRNKKGAAAKAGLRKDDIVVSVDGREVENHQDLIAKISAMVPGRDVKIGILREAGQTLLPKTITVRLDERPNNGVVADNTRRRLPVKGATPNLEPFVGLNVSDITARLSQRYRLRGKTGVVVRKIDPASYLADIKNTSGGDALVPGDVIQRFNRVSVKNVTDFNAMAREIRPGSAVVFHILRYDRTRQQHNPMVVQFTVK